MSFDLRASSEFGDDILLELLDVKRKANMLRKKILGVTQDEDDNNSPPDLEEIRDILDVVIEKQNRMESAFGVEKINLKDVGDRIQVTLDTNFGQFSAHAEKALASPINNSGSTVAGAGGPTVQGGGKGGGPQGMTPEQLQDFKKQSLQIGAIQQKLKELEVRLCEASLSIKKGHDKNTDLEDKSNEHVRELYACIEAINTSLSEKIALQKVEVQKIAGDTPKPINYDPFNYGEAYAGDLVDFQARKRITELKLLVQGLQTALLQMKDSMKVSPSIDLGYKVVRLDELVGSTGFGKKVDSGEVAADEVLVVEQSKERLPGKVEYPRKSMNQTSAEMESKWAITDSIMQTMYRLEMELGEIQKLVDDSGLSGSSKVVEELQQNIKNLKDKQIDLKTVKRLVEDTKESTVSLNATRISLQGRPTPSIAIQECGVTEYTSQAAIRKMENTLRQMQMVVSNLTRHIFGAQKHHQEASLSAAGTRKQTGGRHCMSCDRPVKGESDSVSKPPLPMYSFFSPFGANPRVRGPTHLQYSLNRVYNIDAMTSTPETYSIPRACGGGYTEFWPLPKSFDASRFQAVYEQPTLLADTKYVKGSDGRYYKGQQVQYSATQLRRFTPMSILSQRGQDNAKQESLRQVAVWNTSSQAMGDQKVSVDVVVMAASEEGAYCRDEKEETRPEKEVQVKAPSSQELKKYRFYFGDDDDEEEHQQAGREVDGAVEGRAGEKTNSEYNIERTVSEKSSAGKQVSGKGSQPNQIFSKTSAHAQLSRQSSSQKQISGKASSHGQLSRTASDKKQNSGKNSAQKQAPKTGSLDNQAVVDNVDAGPDQSVEQSNSQPEMESGAEKKSPTPDEELE